MMSLRKGPMTLEQLASSMHSRTGELSTPLRILQETQMVSETEGIYSLKNNSESVNAFLGLVQPWTTFFDGKYLEVAKDVAEVILKKSWSKVEIKDVLLFGSTVKGATNPGDIDMLILHDGFRLQEFNRDPYHERTDWVKESDTPHRHGNERYGATSILLQCGFKVPGDRQLSFDREMPYRLDSTFHNVVKRAEVFGFHVPDIWPVEDERDLFDDLFDLHALSIKLFNTSNDHYNQIRQEAIKNCRDPTFWHNVLNEGKIYDISRHDFSIGVEDKYPGAIALFKR
jgi:hypothetical protein